MTTRTAFTNSLALSALLGSSILGSGAAMAQEVVVGTFGGSFAKAMAECHVAAFEASSGSSVITQEGNSSQFAASIRATGGTSDFDVVYIDNSFATQLAKEGLLDKLDKSKITHAGELVDGTFGADDHFVQYQWGATAIAYNPAAFPEPPTSWEAIFDPANAGEVALPDIAGTAGVHFLIAAARLNGGDINDLDPGYAAIKAIVPNVAAYYTQADQIISMFERGEVNIAPWYPDRAAAAADAGIPVAIAYPVEGAIGIKVALVIPKGAAEPEAAYKYIDTVLSADAQKCFADKMYAGPVNITVKLDGKAAAAVPPDIYGSLYFPDPEIVATHVAEWREKWQREITR